MVHREVGHTIISIPLLKSNRENKTNKHKEKGKKNQKKVTKMEDRQRRLNIHITGVSGEGQTGRELMFKTVIQEDIPEKDPELHNEIAH